MTNGLIAGALIVVLWLLPCFVIAVTWIREYSLHGRNLPRAVRIAARVTWQSGARVFLIGATGVLGGALFAPQWLSLSMGERINSIVVAGTTFAWVLRPPGVLVLASSRNLEARRLISKLGWRASLGHRVLFLLAPIALGQPTTPDAPVRDRMDNLYARKSAAWLSNVSELLDVTPLVVIDARRLSEGLTHELVAVESSPRLVAKTFVVVDETAQVFVAAEFPRLARKMISERNIVEAVATSLAY